MAETTYTSSPWDLTALYPAIKSGEVEGTLERVNQNTDKFEAYREKLSPDMDIEDFYEAISISESSTNILLCNSLWGIIR